MPRRPQAPAVESLGRALARRTAEGVLYERLDGDRVRCVACGHRCVVLPGLEGICRVRFNEGGALRVPRGYVAGLQVDPIEKKPFYHVLPGTRALSFGMLGCDYHCAYCQNWLTSQALRDPEALAGVREVEPDDLVSIAIREGAPAVVSTYNEPLITSEWAVEVFRQARGRGLLCGYVSNGNGTPEVLDYLRPWIDLFKIDLKGFREESYRGLGGRLRPVLDTIECVHGAGIWVEVVTLLVPGFNDDEGELRELTAFLASVSNDLPWHVTAFHADYRMHGRRDTDADDLRKAAAIGREAGLRFVYAGNRPGAVGSLESTLCPGCGETVVERVGYRIGRVTVGADGRCAGCRAPIAGIWGTPA